MKKPDILVSFGGATEQFDRAVKKVKGTTAGLVSSFKKIGSQIAGSLGVGAGLAGAGTLAYVKNMANELDNLAKTSRSLGVTVESLKALEFAVGQTSQLDLGGLTLQLQKITKNIGAAASGSEPMIETFRQLGLEISNLEQMAPDEAYLTVIDALSKMTNEYERAKIAQRLFEDSWRQSILLAKAGRGALEDLAAQQRGMGGATTESAEAAEKFNDSLDVMDKHMDALAMTYGPPVIKFFNELAAVAGVGRNNFQEMNAEMVVLQDRMQALTKPTLTQWLVQLINGGLTPKERADRIKEIQNQIDGLMGTYADARKQQDVIDGAGKDSSKPVVNSEKKKTAAIKKTSRARSDSADSMETSRDRMREAVRAEGSYWQAEHDLISALQDKNAKAVEDARSRMKQAIDDMSGAGASDYRVRYYEERAGVSDADAVPSVTFKPIVDPQGLKEMPELIQKSLDGANFTITVKPILDSGEVGVLQETSDQSGHDES